jgi:hypothetical protein
MDGVVMKANQGLIIVAQVAATQEGVWWQWKYTWCIGWLGVAFDALHLHGVEGHHKGPSSDQI